MDSFFGGTRLYVTLDDAIYQWWVDVSAHWFIWGFHSIGQRNECDKLYSVQVYNP